MARTARDESLARMHRVLSAGARVQLVRLLKERSLCVKALSARLGITQGAVSQHLRVLHAAGLVLAERRGLYVHYRVNPRTLARWREAMLALLAPPQEGAATEPCTAPQ